jgi:hypothetical protein
LFCDRKRSSDIKRDGRKAYESLASVHSQLGIRGTERIYGFH